MKRGGEERERKREGGQSSSHGVRSTERSIFFLRFSFLPLPFQPFSLHPLLVDTLGARVYVRFLHPLSSSPSLVPVHSFVESPLGFFGPRNTEWWWWWMATQVEVANDSLTPPFYPVYPFFHLSLPPLLLDHHLPSKRRKERNAAELQRAQSRG